MLTILEAYMIIQSGNTVSGTQEAGSNEQTNNT